MARHTTWLDFYRNLSAGSRRIREISQTPAAKTATWDVNDYSNQKWPKAPSVGSTPGKHLSFWDQVRTGITAVGLAQGNSGNAGTAVLGATLAGIANNDDSGDVQKQIDQSTGGRVLDLMARPLYASTNAIKADVERQKDPNGPSYGSADYWSLLGNAFARGLEGKDKTSTVDILKAKGIEPPDSTLGKVAYGAAGFAGDMLFDPTSYISGAGVLRAGRAVRDTVRGTRTISDVRDIANTEKALEGVVVDPQSKPVRGLIEGIKKNNPDYGGFDEIFSKKPSEYNAHPSRSDAEISQPIPNEPRTFYGGTGGLTENIANAGAKQLGGPPADVITARARLSAADELAAKTNKFEYGSWIDQVPETGWYKEVKRKVPVENPLRNSATDSREALLEKYKDLGDADLPAPTNRNNAIIRMIMSRVDEPVFPKYEPYEFVPPGAKKPVTAWRPDPMYAKDGIPMGEIRRQLKDPKVPAARKTALKRMLVNHIRTVSDYSKALAEGGADTGFGGKRGADKFFKEMYGNTPSEIMKGKTPDLPPSVWDKQPKFEEISEFVKMDWQEKLGKLAEWESEGLSPAHSLYLAQASNKKSFATRLAKLREMTAPVKNAIDLADAIDAGKVAADEPGLDALYKHFRVKKGNLQRLSQQIRAAEVKKTAAETKMLGKTGEAATKTPAERAKFPEYKPKPYGTNIGKMVQDALNRAANTTPSQRIVEKALNGDKSELARPAVEFSESQQSLFDHAIQWAINENIISPKDTKLYKWVTKRGVKRTSPTPNKGRGRIGDAWNKNSQLTFFYGLMKKSRTMDREFKTWAATQGISNKDMRWARARFYYNMTMKPMEAMDNVFRQGGIFPVAGLQKNSTPFSFYDAFASLDRSYVERFIFNMVGKETNAKSVIAPTQLVDAMDLGVTALRKTNDSPENIADVIKAALLEQQVTRNGRKVPNALRTLAEKKPEIADRAVEGIIDALPDLIRRIEQNEAARKLWHENQRAAATQEAFDAIAEQVMSPDINLSKLLELSNSVTEDLLPRIKRTNGIDPEDAFYVDANVNAGMTEFAMPPWVRAAAAEGAARARAKTSAARTALDEKAIRQSEEEITRIMDEEGIPLSAVETKWEGTVLHRLISQIFPHFGNEVVRDMFLKQKLHYGGIANTYAEEIRTINGTHANVDLKSAFAELQRGQWSKNPEILAAQKDLNKAIGVMFSDNSEVSLFTRMGLDPADLKPYLEQYKVPRDFQPGGDFEIHNIWRIWETDDPLAMLNKYFAATTRLATRKTLTDHLTSIPEFASHTPKPGYVKLKKGSSFVLRTVDTDNVYFSKKIARELNLFDKFLKMDSRPFYDGPFGDILKFYDNMIHKLKGGYTIYRPGHHTRNMVGDLFFNYMAGIDDPRVYNKALKVQASMRGRYQNFDAVRALMEGRVDVPLNEAGRVASKFNPEDVISTVKINGKEYKLTAEQLYRAGFDRGILPDYRTIEDLQFGNAGQYSTGSRLTKPFGGKVHQFAATVSSERDHYVRLSHFIGTLEKNAGKSRSLNEAFEKAASEVRKWHPDGSDLSYTEARVFRRTVLFYSWIRKAIPLVIEGMAMKPGRALAFPKAIYNIAEANGIELNGLGDFPEDQMFPDWIRDSLTPPIAKDSQGQYWSVNPGIPQMDVLNDYGGHEAWRSAAGSLAPPIKNLIEMMNAPDGGVATDLRTGIPIFDKSDYLDNQIPMANALRGLTGRSPSSGFTQAKGGDTREPQPDQQRTIVNFLSGLGLLNTSKYQGQAAREQGAKDKKAQQERQKKYLQDLYGN